MSRVTTTLTGFEARTGTGKNGPWKAMKFSDSEGKRYDVFIPNGDTEAEALAQKGKDLVTEEAMVVIDFSSRTQAKADGSGTWVNNDINGLYKLGEEPEQETPEKQRGGGKKAFSPLAARVSTVDVAERIMARLVDSGQVETYALSGIFEIADAIFAYADKRPEAPAAETSTSETTETPVPVPN